MPGAGLTAPSGRKARPDKLALKPYRGKLAVRNFREGDGNVGIIRSPVRAIAPPNQPDHVIDIEQEDARRRVKELTGSRGADVVIEVTANSPEPDAEALHHVAVGGRIVLAGVKGFRAVPEFVSDLLVVKEAQMLGAFGVPSPAYEAAIRLIESGRVPLAEMHTHDFALEDAERAIQTLAGEMPGEVSIHSCLLPLEF
jgi:threonine dehydrogenase-like Zn-dependent dehydrogenase